MAGKKNGKNGACGISFTCGSGFTLRPPVILLGAQDAGCLVYLIWLQYLLA